MTKNPIGMVYKINDKFSRDQAVAYSKAAHHYTTTSIDDFELAQRLKTEAGVHYSIYRNTNWEPGNLKGQSESVILAAAESAYQAIRHADRSVHILINNEQEWTNERFLFYIGLINETMADSTGPVGMVFGNFSSGSIKSGQGDDENWYKTTPNAADFFRLMSDYEGVKLPDGTQAFVYGIHEYTALFPWSASNGGEYVSRFDWEHALPTIDWTKPQWHLGRNLQGIRNAGLPVPYMLVTESLFDNMRDIVDAWTIRHSGHAVGEFRGYRTHADFWKAHGYTAPVGETYQRFLEWAWKNVWSSSDRILGAQVYIMNRTGEWESSFDVSGDADFQKANLVFRDEYLPTPEPPPEPISLEARVAALELQLQQAQYVTKPQLQGYFQQLMDWTANYFVAKNAFKGILNFAKEAVDKQNVDDSQ